MSYPGNTITVTYTFTDLNNAVYDPSTITWTVKDPSGTVQATKALSDFTRLSTGIYQLSWNLPNPATAGTWKRIVNATYTTSNLNVTREFQFFVLSS
jgi:uncharacterized protein YfaS (alpha-2-macroglobulin family)